jgi:hypothetical protein
MTVEVDDLFYADGYGIVPVQTTNRHACHAAINALHKNSELFADGLHENWYFKRSDKSANPRGFTATAAGQHGRDNSITRSDDNQYFDHLTDPIVATLVSSPSTTDVRLN